MGTAQCFKCNRSYPSDHPDDLAGDGKCEGCKEFSKKVAFKIDIETAERRRNNPLEARFGNFKDLIDQLPEDGRRGNHIKATDLGINYGN